MYLYFIEDFQVPEEYEPTDESQLTVFISDTRAYVLKAVASNYTAFLADRAKKLGAHIRFLCPELPLEGVGVTLGVIPFEGDRINLEWGRDAVTLNLLTGEVMVTETP